MRLKYYGSLWALEYLMKLDRSYSKYIDKNNATGRQLKRQFFEGNKKGAQ